jgi:hypothetical protein
VVIAHVISRTIAVENIYAVSGIIEVIKPTTAITDVGKAVAIVAAVVTVPRAVGVAVIIAVAVIVITKAHVINAAR